ncbi:MAG: phosphotransferase [Pseudomonadales bacterium]
MHNEPTTLPAMPAGLTPDWLTAVLHDAGIGTTNTITAAERSQVGDGVGMMSELSRLTLTWSTPDASLPASLIAKYASTNPMNRQAAGSFHVYEREVRYFLEVDARTTARTPRCYYARLEGDACLLLMEDLTGYRVGSQADGSGLADTRLAIDELAKLHAPFWNNVSSFPWVPHVVNSYHADAMIAMANGGWDNMVTVFADHFPASVLANRNVILDAIPAMQAVMDQAPNTFIHGDYRADNLLFGQVPGQAPIVVIDWQGPMLCRGMVDVALVLGQNTHIEVRREHERAIVRRYVDGLAALGVEYPFTSAWEHYLDALAYQWCYCATVTARWTAQSPVKSVDVGTHPSPGGRNDGP